MKNIKPKEIITEEELNEECDGLCFGTGSFIQAVLSEFIDFNNDKNEGEE